MSLWPFLVIEASTVAGSVAVVTAEGALADVPVRMGAARTDSLFPAVQEALLRAKLDVSELAGLVCGSGPGSFTSLRIAASLAKGLAHGTGKSLFAVPSLLLAAASHRVAGEYIVHSDALRGERFCRRVLIDEHGVRALDRETLRVPHDLLDEVAPMLPRLVVGDAPLSDADVACITPRAALLSHVLDWADAGAVSLERWEPDYGRLAEAQVVWERTHGTPLPA